MNFARKLIAAAALGLVAASMPVRAEVSAETDAFGTYLRTVIYANASIKNVRIWSVSRYRAGYWPVNVNGDATGDLFPAVGENPARQRWPWLLWSRFNGHDYDLMWAQWLGTGWSPVLPVETSANPEDAVEPSIAFDVAGRAHAVWLARGDGPGRVYLSIFLASRWMERFLVSDPDEDSLNPSVVVLPDGKIQVSYDTPRGRITRTIQFAKPRTITDDLTPFSTLSVSETSAPVLNH